MTDKISGDTFNSEEKEDFYLSEYFKKEFPHLAQFLEENLINKTTDKKSCNNGKN